MSPLLTPGIGAVVRCVRQALDDLIAPKLEGQAERSYVTTAVHLLRLVERRVDAEGQILFDEERLLRPLLGEGSRWLRSIKSGCELAGRIDARIARERSPDVYPSLPILSTEVAELRLLVCALLERLLEEEAKGKASGEDLHRKLRSYIAWQLEQEQAIVESAFRGHGPRR